MPAAAWISGVSLVIQRSSSFCFVSWRAADDVSGQVDFHAGGRRARLAALRNLDLYPADVLLVGGRPRSLVVQPGADGFQFCGGGDRLDLEIGQHGTGRQPPVGVSRCRSELVLPAPAYYCFADADGPDWRHGRPHGRPLVEMVVGVGPAKARSGSAAGTPRPVSR